MAVNATPPPPLTAAAPPPRLRPASSSLTSAARSALSRRPSNCYGMPEAARPIAKEHISTSRTTRARRRDAPDGGRRFLPRPGSCCSSLPRWTFPRYRACHHRNPNGSAHCHLEIATDGSPERHPERACILDAACRITVISSRTAQPRATFSHGSTLSLATRCNRDAQQSQCSAVQCSEGQHRHWLAPPSG